MPFHNTIICPGCRQHHDLYYTNAMDAEHRHSFICPATSQTISIPASATTEVHFIPRDAICPIPVIPPAEILQIGQNQSGGWILFHPDFANEGIALSSDEHDKYLAGGNAWKHQLLQQFAKNSRYAELFCKWGINLWKKHSFRSYFWLSPAQFAHLLRIVLVTLVPHKPIPKLLLSRRKDSSDRKLHWINHRRKTFPHPFRELKQRPQKRSKLLEETCSASGGKCYALFTRFQTSG